MADLSPDEVEKLAEKWLEGTLTDEQERIFNTWYEQQPKPVIPFHSTDKNAEDFKSRVLAEIRTSVHLEAPTLKKTGARRTLIWTAAAAVLLGIGLFTYQWMQPGTPQKSITQGIIDVAPGSSKATLTLAGGEVIYLDSSDNGQLTRQGGAVVVKMDYGMLAYQADKSRSSASNKPGLLWNTLKTPVGGDYKLILADGSKVWLNAASSIKYPATFTGDTRTVEITGEAYFEVVHNDMMPFRVIAGATIINDLGTHFNVNAYRDEPKVSVTLLEGAVEVEQSTANTKKRLEPGQQVDVDRAGHMLLDKKADIQGAVAWKNGLLNFNGKDLAAIMRQLERWYNVSVRYPTKMPPLVFSGDTYRNSSLAEVLKVLELNGVNCRLEKGSPGRAATIVIAP